MKTCNVAGLLHHGCLLSDIELGVAVLAGTEFANVSYHPGSSLAIAKPRKLLQIVCSLWPGAGLVSEALQLELFLHDQQLLQPLVPTFLLLPLSCPFYSLFLEN